MKTLTNLMKCAGVALTMCSACLCASAEEPVKPLQYVDAQELRIINKGWENTLRKYTRIPATLKDSVDAVFKCCRNAGVFSESVFPTFIYDA